MGKPHLATTWVKRAQNVLSLIPRRHRSYPPGLQQLVFDGREDVALPMAYVCLHLIGGYTSVNDLLMASERARARESQGEGGSLLGPDACLPQCGDGLAAGDEGCDDGEGGTAHGQ